MSRFSYYCYVAMPIIKHTTKLKWNLIVKEMSEIYFFPPDTMVSFTRSKTCAVS